MIKYTYFKDSYGVKKYLEYKHTKYLLYFNMGDFNRYIGVVKVLSKDRYIIIFPNFKYKVFYSWVKVLDYPYLKV